MPVTTARIKIYKEADNAYTLLAFKRLDTNDEIVQESLSGFNIAASAVTNALSNAITSMIPSGERIQEADMGVLYRPSGV